MTREYEILLNAAKCLRARLKQIPEVGVVLGSGLGGFAEEFPNKIAYGDIPGLRTSTVGGHRGVFAEGETEGRHTLAMMGRVHYYEGCSAAEVVRPIRVMALLGVRKLILTNVSGGINPELGTGSPVMIKGHMSFLMPSPLRGENIEELGTRFADMSAVYSPRILASARRIFADAGAEYREGVYLQVPGPQYETPEEISAFRAWGADMVGMSTATEAVAARHAGMEVAGVSLIANAAAGLGTGELSHEEVKAAAALGAERFNAVLKGLVHAI